MRRIPVVVLAVILVLACCSLPFAYANEPPTRIIAVHYPTTVRTGELFTVTIQVAYSARFGMMDVGIWDLGTGSAIQSLVTNVTLSGPGHGEYSFSLRASESPGQWRLAAITRAWVQEAWFNDKAGEFDFSVRIAENGLLVLTGLQPNLTISLDDRSILANSSTAVIVLKLGGLYSLGVPERIQSGLGRRLTFTEWSDGLRSNPRSILFTENMSIRPIYTTQYLLTVNSDLSVVAGGGWYREGEVAQFGMASTFQSSPSLFSLFTSSSQFTRWSGDSTSTELTTTIMMDGPKTVVAQWKRSTLFPNLNGLSAIFTLGCLVLGIRALRITRHQHLTQHRKKITRLSVILLISISTIISPVTVVSGQLPVPVNSSVVQVGDAYWYYWKQPASDTCILWFGGGVEYSQGGYLLNPLEYESFGTIRFLQDLTKYYCLLALEKGPNPSPSVSNRTIYQELVQGQFSMGKQLHQWINAQGYKHVFLIGYSVGTEAAASIVTSEPQTWTSSDGLILITAWLPPAVIGSVSNLNSNLMLLYGHAPEFEPTGLRLYQNAPTEGWHGPGYLHKEFHVLDQMGHEVWSPLKDNSYSPMAIGITVNFIETSKALQFERVAFQRNMSENGGGMYALSQLEVPTTILSDEPFFASAVVSSSNRSYIDAALVAYDFETNHTLSVNQFNGTTLPTSIRLNMSPVANSSRLSFSLLVLERDGKEWKVASMPYTVAMSVTDQIVFRISGLVPNSDLIVDSIRYTVPPTGRVQLETRRGAHIYSVQGTVDQNNTRYLFVEWNDFNKSIARSITLTENTSVNVIYRAQYYVTVTSPVGWTDGSGWYDVNSTIQPSLHPIASSPPPLVFDSWTNGNESFQIGDPVQVRSPMVIQAVWVQVPLVEIDSLAVTWLVASGILFSLLLILNVKLDRRKLVK